MTARNAIVAFLTFVVPMALANQRVDVITDIKPTATAQLMYAQSLAMDVGRARTDDERHRAVAQASSAFAAVRRHWPTDANAYLQSVLMEGDLFLSGNAPANVIKLLEPLQSRLVGNPNEAALLRRLGTAHAMVGETEQAEVAFRKALASKAAKNPEQDFLARRAAALLYARTSRHREAAELYRGVMRNAALRDSIRADAALDSLRELLHANDRASARASLAEVRAIVNRAAKTALPDTVRSRDRELARLTDAAQ